MVDMREEVFDQPIQRTFGASSDNHGGWELKADRDDGRPSWRKQLFLGRPMFFKILLMQDFAVHLRIPPTFVISFLKNASKRAFLCGQVGGIWQVEIRNMSNDLYLYLYLCGGWEKFAKEHCLQLGDLLIFTYEGNMHFSVTIFDKTASNILLRFSTKPSQVSKHKKTSNMHCLPEKKMLHFGHVSQLIAYNNHLEMHPKVVYQEQSHSNPNIICHVTHSGEGKRKRGRPRKSVQNAKVIAQDIPFEGEIKSSKNNILQAWSPLAPCKVGEATIDGKVKKLNIKRMPPMELITNLGACMKKPVGYLQAQTDTVVTNSGQHNNIPKEKRKRGRPRKKLLLPPPVAGHILCKSEPPKRQDMHLRPHSYQTQYHQFYTIRGQATESSENETHVKIKGNRVEMSASE